ncbi:MAG TPA: low molecular weight protein-tyrosine-phosphatase [Nevskiales bacterium]|nr:low molecular weight protein-tyrosine-phosphatase [Nevskiales bacterium]
MPGNPAPLCSVLFVCMGNICRSPTAEGVFRELLREAGLLDRIRTDSAGTHAYHVGSPPDPRALQAAQRRGIDLSGLRARVVQREDFRRFDYVLAMDNENLSHLSRLQPKGTSARLSLLMAYAPPHYPREVPDPYYGGRHGFEMVLDMVEAGCRGLLQDILRQQALGHD